MNDRPSEKSSISKEDLDLWKAYTSQTSALTSQTPINKIPIKRTNFGKRLDLHGYTIQRAFQVTVDFLEFHILAKTKSVVIICGKGGKIADELPLWCERVPAVRRCVPIVDSRGEYGAFTITFRRI